MALHAPWAFHRTDSTVLITDAEHSKADEHTYRVRRYAITMGIRMACIVLAVLLRGTPWVWAAIVGAVVLPWSAVLMANDRLPRTHRKVAWHEGDQPTLDGGDRGRVIDGGPPTE